MVRRKDSLAADGLLNRNLKSETSRDKAHHSKHRTDVSRSTIIYLLIPHDWKQRACVFCTSERLNLIKSFQVWSNIAMDEDYQSFQKRMPGLADFFFLFLQ